MRREQRLRQPRAEPQQLIMVLRSGGPLAMLNFAGPRRDPLLHRVA